MLHDIVTRIARPGCVAFAALGLLAACAYGDPAGGGGELSRSGGSGESSEDESSMTAKEKQKVALLREAITLGLGLGKTTLTDEVNVELGHEGITTPYKPASMTGKGYTPPAAPTCPFLAANPSGENVDCRAIVTRATVSAYARTTAVQGEYPLDSRFTDIKAEGSFWYSEAFGTGIDNEATAAVYQLRAMKVCDQSPEPTQSAYDAGVERGRLLYIEAVNKRLADEGYNMSYPDNVTPIPVCNANTAFLEPARMHARDDANAWAQANPLCAGYNPSSVDEVARVADAEKQFQSGMQTGIDTEHSLAGEKIFQVIQCNVGDPLVLDLAGDGVHIVPVEASSARFDLFGSGARVAVAWIQGDDALLALDANGNGQIDSGRELLGNFKSGSRFEEVRDGFEHLAMYDRPCAGGNGDGQITAADEVYSRLLAWQDSDGDGASEPGELRTLEQAGVQSIGLSADGRGRAPFARSGWAANLAGSDSGVVMDVWLAHGRSRVSR